MIIKKSDLPAYKAQGYTIEHHVSTLADYHFYRILDKDGKLVATTRQVELRRA